MRCSAVVLAVLLLAGGAIGWSSSAQAFSRGFIENQGQIGNPVKYYAAGSRAAVYFTPGAVVVDLKEGSGDSKERESGRADRSRRLGRESDFPQAGRGCAVYIRFAGANPSPAVEARERQPASYNYFLGKDPSQWRANVSAYAEVVYHDVWPGVDLVFREEEGKLIYDVVTSRGADARAVRFRYDGAVAVTEGEGGSSRVETAIGTLVHTPPVAGVREGSLGLWRTPPGGTQDDPLAQLRDDPSALLWSTFLGGSDWDEGDALTIDSSGNPLVTGYTCSSDFPTTPGAYDNSFAGAGDVVVAKLSSSGDALLWSTFLGGSDWECGSAIALDAAGNPTVTGSTYSTDFPTTPEAYDRSHAGSVDVFVAKLASTGSALLWSTFLGGSGFDQGLGIAFDASANPVVTGQTESPEFPTTPGAYDTSLDGNGDVFVTKLASTGSALLWSTFLGGSVWEVGYAVALDASGDPAVMGYTFSDDFPTNPGAYDTSYNWGEGGYPGDVFIAKLASSGSALVWSTYLGGFSEDQGFAMALDASGNPVVAGRTASTDFPTTPGAYSRLFSGVLDVFVAKLASSGDALLWGTFLGGTNEDDAWALALDGPGNAVVAGTTASTDFPTTPGAYDRSYNGGEYDVFVAKLASSGDALLESTFLGGYYGEYEYGLALDASGNPIVTGATFFWDFPTTPGAYDTEYNGGETDAFIAKLEMGIGSAVTQEVLLARTELLAAVPNPFCPNVSVEYTLAEGGDVALGIYDVTGRLVRELRAERGGPGRYTEVWDGRDGAGREVAGGVYFVRLVAGQQKFEQKAVLIR